MLGSEWRPYMCSGRQRGASIRNVMEENASGICGRVLSDGYGSLAGMHILRQNA